MSPKKQSKVWIMMLISVALFLLWTLPLLLLSGGQAILEEGLKYSASSFDIGLLDEGALGFIKMAMLKPLWEEVWIGILGIYCAVNLKKMEEHAWWLGFFWGIMLITNAAIQGTYEVVNLHWTSACLQTYLFLVLGAVVVASLLFAKKLYLRNPA